MQWAKVALQLKPLLPTYAGGKLGVWWVDQAPLPCKSASALCFDSEALEPDTSGVGIDGEAL